MWDRHDPRSLDTPDRPTPDRGESPGPDPRDRVRRDPRDAFTDGLDLPRGLERERVLVHDETHRLRGSEVRALATVGAFRVVPVDDMRGDRDQPGDLWHGDLDRLRTTGLIRVVGPLDRDSRTTVVTLTERGRELLEANRDSRHEPVQAFYAGVSRSRELAHDAQVYRAYERSARQLAARDARILRIVLEHELKRDYQRFLQEPNRDRSDADGRPKRTREEVRAWADAHDLSMLDGRVQFPVLRIEFELLDGRREIENDEVTTLHYRGMHASGKASAGFTRYRAVGGRVGGGGGRRGGGRMRDPGLAEELLR